MFLVGRTYYTSLVIGFLMLVGAAALLDQSQYSVSVEYQTIVRTIEGETCEEVDPPTKFWYPRRDAWNLPFGGSLIMLVLHPSLAHSFLQFMNFRLQFQVGAR
jgi:hypothetical protein